MRIEHVGVVNRTEAEAERFYAGVLELPRVKVGTVSAPLAFQIFGISEELPMVVFARAETKVEVFIVPGWLPASQNIAHACLAVQDLTGLLARAEAAGARVIRAEHLGKVVHFLSDYAGNLVEVKAAV